MKKTAVSIWGDVCCLVGERWGFAERDLWMGRLGRGRPGDAGTGQAPTVPSQFIGNGKRDAMQYRGVQCRAKTALTGSKVA